MNSFVSTYWSAKLLDYEYGGVALPNIPIWYVGLSTQPAAKDSIVEVGSGIGYARVAVASTLAKFPAAIASWKTNADPITFPVATGPWTQVLSAFLVDASGIGAGNLCRSWDIPSHLWQGCNPIVGSPALVIPAKTLWLARN